MFKPRPRLSDWVRSPAVLGLDTSCRVCQVAACRKAGVLRLVVQANRRGAGDGQILLSLLLLLLLLVALACRCSLLG